MSWLLISVLLLSLGPEDAEGGAAGPRRARGLLQVTQRSMLILVVCTSL